MSRRGSAGARWAAVPRMAGGVRAVLVPASNRDAASALQQRAEAFARVIAVREYVRLSVGACRDAREALASGHERWDRTRRITSRATLRERVSEAACQAGWKAHDQGATAAEARAIRAVVRAYVFRTSLARRTVELVLAVGGWYAEIGMLVLERVR